MSLGLSMATEVLLTAMRSVTITAMISNPSFAEDQPCMTPQTQWNFSLPIQWCLLNPYGRVRVVGSCLLLLCPWGCQCWPQKFWWLLGSITVIFNPSFAENQHHMTPQSQWNCFLPIQQNR
jgi:hypothetical protein